MAWKINFELEAEEDLLRLDRSVNERVISKLSWLQENFENITPIPLSNVLTGVFKLRVGDYRVLYIIKQEKRVINIVDVDHRSKIYKIFQQRWHH